MFRTTAFATAFALLAGAAFAEPKAYSFDTGHSQIVFTYEHLGFSTTTGMFSGIQGEIEFDPEAPENSAVKANFPLSSLMTGDAGRDEHFLSPDFFGAEENPAASFHSTSVEVTGENTALITGDLTLNGITKEVVLDATLNQHDTHPMEEKEWLGVDATTTLLRSDFDMGTYAPAVSDEVTVRLSIEAMVAG